MRTMGSHQSGRMISDTWLTPPEIITSLGEFDLDPCAAENMPWITAHRMVTKQEDGLSIFWHGRVWLNPPYSREAVKWLQRLKEHGNGIALIFARTETKWFFENVWRGASGILFLKGRIHFYTPDGRRASANAGAPSVLVAYGEENNEALEKCGIPGKFIRL